MAIRAIHLTIAQAVVNVILFLALLHQLAVGFDILPYENLRVGLLVVAFFCLVSALITRMAGRISAGKPAFWG